MDTLANKQYNLITIDNSSLKEKISYLNLLMNMVNDEDKEEIKKIIEEIKKPK